VAASAFRIKNIRLFHGRPLIAYSIEAARKSGVFSRVIVSTDSEEIASTARQWGAQTPFSRPESLADDYTPTAEVLLHALDSMEDLGEAPDTFCCIYATAPFIRPKDLAEGYALLKQQAADTVFPVTRFGYPIYRGLKMLDDGRVAMIWPENLNRRSQDLPEAYHDAGQFYWANAAAFRVSRQLFTENSYPLVLPRRRVVDIDTEEDWRLAEVMYRVLEEIQAGGSAEGS
jgi:N-acylneuraminate cytidylyltransferase